MTLSPQLRALGPQVRLLNALIDAMALVDNWNALASALALFNCALIAESDRSEGWNQGSAERQMAEWGAKDQYGIYNAAGLTERQQEVAFLFFDRRLEPIEIAGLLGCDAITVRRHLQNIRERLQKLA